MAIPNFRAIRSGLLAELQADDGVAGVRHYSGGALSGVPGFPALVVGAFKTEQGDAITACLTPVQVPIAVVVGRPADNDQATINLLDDLLGALLDRLDQMAGSNLGGSVSEWHPIRSVFIANFPVGAQVFPAHTVFLAIQA